MLKVADIFCQAKTELMIDHRPLRLLNLSLLLKHTTGNRGYKATLHRSMGNGYLWEQKCPWKKKCRWKKKRRLSAIGGYNGKTKKAAVRGMETAPFLFFCYCAD